MQPHTCIGIGLSPLGLVVAVKSQKPWKRFIIFISSITCNICTMTLYKIKKIIRDNITTIYIPHSRQNVTRQFYNRMIRRSTTQTTNLAANNPTIPMLRGWGKTQNTIRVDIALVNYCQCQWTLHKNTIQINKILPIHEEENNDRGHVGLSLAFI